MTGKRFAMTNDGSDPEAMYVTANTQLRGRCYTGLPLGARIKGGDLQGMIYVSGRRSIVDDRLM